MVKTANGAAMFNCKRGKMRVIGEVARSACTEQQPGQHVGVPFSGMDDTGSRMRQPLIHHPNGITYRKRLWQNRPVG